MVDIESVCSTSELGKATELFASEVIHVISDWVKERFHEDDYSVEFSKHCLGTSYNIAVMLLSLKMDVDPNDEQMTGEEYIDGVVLGLRQTLESYVRFSRRLKGNVQ